MPGEIKIKTPDREIPIQVIRSSRKTMGLEVRRTGEVLARVPHSLTDQELKAFIMKNQEWIKKHVFLEMKEQTTTNATPLQEMTTEEIKRIKQKFAARVSHYGKKMGVTWGRVTIRNQKTRWGSCSSKGNLNFNYQLYYLSDELLDYVVVHELAHRRHMNHSPQFWAEVEQYYPDYRESRRRLKEIRII